MKPGAVLAAGIALIVAVSGSACLTPDQLSAMQTDITTMRSQMDELQKQNAATAASVEAMKQSMATREDGSRSASAEFNRQVQAIRDDIRALGSRIDELQHRLSGLSDGAPGGAPRIPSSPSGAAPGSPSDSGSELSGDELAPAGNADRAGGTGGPGASPSMAGAAGASGGGAAAEDLFNGAYADYSKGNYEPAILGFQGYLTKYPRSDKADDALYWIGLCHYDQGQYTEAIASFDRILQEYPDGDKSAGAQLKKGLSLLEMNRTAQGVVQLQAVTDHYPRSEEARIARDRLSELGVKP